jgi:hypothetical protein
VLTKKEDRKVDTRKAVGAGKENAQIEGANFVAGRNLYAIRCKTDERNGGRI